MSLGLTPEEWAIIRREVDASPPLTAAQVSRISMITGFVPRDRNAVA